MGVDTGIPIEDDQHDEIRWKRQPAWTAYTFQFEGGTQSWFPQKIWKVCVSMKCKIFMWLLALDRLWTANRLQQRGWPSRSASAVFPPCRMANGCSSLARAASGSLVAAPPQGPPVVPVSVPGPPPPVASSGSSLAVAATGAPFVAVAPPVINPPVYSPEARESLAGLGVIASTIESDIRPWLQVSLYCFLSCFSTVVACSLLLVPGARRSPPAGGAGALGLGAPARRGECRPRRCGREGGAGRVLAPA